MSVQLEFSRHAEAYGHYSLVQQQVVSKLLGDLEGERPARILDLGCGSGALFKALEWQPEYFAGIDFAPGMLELHPKGEHIECIYGDFNDSGLFDRLNGMRFDRVFSASALQWADDLDTLFGRIAALGTPVSLGIFTSGTFHTLLQTAAIPSLLRSAEELSQLALRHFGVPGETLEYTLAFDDTRRMFRYIKRSGVSGRRNALNVTETRRLMQTYPLPYLEFEVFFLHT